MKVYIVDDEKNLNDLLAFHLKNEGWEVYSFYSSVDAYKHADDNIDLWILDIMMPEIDGYTLIKQIKSKNPYVPVIFISARDTDVDRVVGLEVGSDDYITKPFLPRELIIRAKRLMEREQTHTPPASRKKIDEFHEIDYSLRILYFQDKAVELTSKEYDFIIEMVKNPNRAFSREDLLNKVWGINYFGSDRVVDDLVRRIRKKLPYLKIETLYGYGYRWCGCE